MDKIINYAKENKKEIIAVSGIFILAFILRIIALFNFGDMSLDEVYSWFFATQKTAFSAAKNLVIHDVHTPLYFVILHFWTKIFGESPKAMRFCSLLISIPLIPFAFYLAKKHFNAMTGYFAAILLAINTFCVFYSVQIRFYSLILPLTLVLGFLYLDLLDENFKKRNSIYFIIVHTLLVYTFTLSLILSFFYAFVGFVYLLIKKRNLKEFTITYLISAILACPAVYFVIYNISVMKNNLCIHSHEFFTFSWLSIYDMLENLFSSENYQLIMRSIATFRNMFENASSPRYFLLVLIPILISLFALLRALFSKNSKLYLLFTPAILTIITVFILSYTEVMYLQVKYLSIVFPIIICCCAFGFSAINNKRIGIILFALLIYLNSMYIIFIPVNIYSYGAKEISGNLNHVANEQIAIQDDDIIFTPFIPEKFGKIINKGKVIPFAMDESLLLKNKKPLIYYFGEEKLSTLTKDNVREEILSDLMQGKVEEVYEKNLYNDYIKKMKPFQRFIILSPYTHVTGSLSKPLNVTKDNYKKFTNFEFVITKSLRDTAIIVQKHLRFMGIYYDPTRGYEIYIFEKS